MKKFTILAAVLGMTLSAYAAPATQTTTTTTTTVTTPAAPAMPLGIYAIGYDVDLGHVTARLGLGENQALDIGVGFSLNTTEETPVDDPDNNFQMGVSAFYLVKLQEWGPVDNHLALGGVFSKLPQADDNIQITLFAGLQPEVTLMDRLILSTRFGMQMDLIPAFVFETVGQGISIVSGVNFKVIW